MSNLLSIFKVYTQKIRQLFLIIKKENTITSWALILTVLTLTSIFLLRHSLQIAYADDDWLGIWAYMYDLGAGAFFAPYGNQIGSFYYLSNFFNHNAPYIHIVAIFLRLLASFGILALVYFLTHNRTSAFIGALTYTVGFSGVQAIVEPVNMIVYLSIAVCSIFLIFFFLARNKPTLKHYLLMFFFFFLTTTISPIRMFPLIVWCIIVDGIWLIANFSKKTLKAVAIRQAILLAIFLTLFQLGSFGISTGQKNLYVNFFKDSSNNLTQQYLNEKFINNLFMGIGNVILPDERKTVTFINMIEVNKIIGAIYLLTILIFTFSIRRLGKYGLIIFTFLLWVPIFYFAYISSITHIYGERLIDSFRRYLIVPFAGFSVLIGILASLVIKTKYDSFKTIFIILIIPFIFFHSSTLNRHLSDMAINRNYYVSRNLWSQLVTLVPYLPIEPGKPRIFYIEHENTPVLHYSIHISFSLRTAIIYNLPHSGVPYYPQPVSVYTDLLSVVKDGQLLKAHGYKPEPVPWDRIYAFRLEGEKLIDIKQEIMQRVSTDLKQE